MLDLRKCALEFVNGIIVDRGCEPVSELVPGTKGEPEMCPISNTLREAVGVEYVHTDDDGVRFGGPGAGETYELDPCASRFITEFDTGAFPELVDPDDEDDSRVRGA